MNKQKINVGYSIRRKRKELGLTIKELAEQAGLSTAYISQVERANSMPSLISLYQISDVLKVSTSELIQTSKSFQTYRKGTDLTQILVDSDIGYFRLSNPFPNQKIDPVLLEIPGQYESTNVQGEGFDGEGFLFVLEGTVSVEYQDEEFELKPTDSMHYDLKHSLSVTNKALSPAKALWVGSIIIE